MSYPDRRTLARVTPEGLVDEALRLLAERDIELRAERDGDGTRFRGTAGDAAVLWETLRELAGAPVEPSHRDEAGDDVHVSAEHLVFAYEATGRLAFARQFTLEDGRDVGLEVSMRLSPDVRDHPSASIWESPEHAEDWAEEVERHPALASMRARDVTAVTLAWTRRS